MTPLVASSDLARSMVDGTTETNGHPVLTFDPIPECIEAFKQGQFLIVLDSPSRENEGDLIIAARALTPATAAFLIRHTSGYLCAPLTPARAAALALPRMIPAGDNQDPNGTAYCVSVDAAHQWGTTTGISAVERAATANLLGGVEPRLPGRDAVPTKVGAADLRRPGHVLPLIARDGGVRQRRGHTEAGVEFARLAGLTPAVAVIGELVEDDVVVAAAVGGKAARVDEGPGRPGYATSAMMRADGCVAFGRRWGIRVCTIEALTTYVEGVEGTWGDGALR